MLTPSRFFKGLSPQSSIKVGNTQRVSTGRLHRAPRLVNPDGRSRSPKRRAGRVFCQGPAPHNRLISNHRTRPRGEGQGLGVVRGKGLLLAAQQGACPCNLRALCSTQPSTDQQTERAGLASSPDPNASLGEGQGFEQGEGQRSTTPPPPLTARGRAWLGREVHAANFFEVLSLLVALGHGEGLLAINNL